MTDMRFQGFVCDFLAFHKRKSHPPERKAGELLSDMAESGQRPRGRKKESHESTLSDLGVSRDESSRWQREAEVPAGKFESWVAERNAAGEEVTQSGLLKIAMAERQKQREATAEEAKEEAAMFRQPPKLSSTLIALAFSFAVALA